MNLPNVLTVIRILLVLVLVVALLEKTGISPARGALADSRSGRPLWLDRLIHLTVAITVLPGADYFCGLWRGSPSRSGDGVEPGSASGVRSRGGAA